MAMRQGLQEEWGPWIEHDGLGCPVPSGTVVEVVYQDAFGYKSKVITTAMGGSFSSWNWEFYPELKKILHYRERKPKGLQLLEELLSELDHKAPAKPADTRIRERAS